jgi:hypothetical protein
VPGVPTEVDQIKGALTKKIGPFPGWAWAGIAAVGVWLLAPHLGSLTGSSASAGAATGTVTDTTGVSAAPSSPTPAASPAGSVAGTPGAFQGLLAGPAPPGGPQVYASDNYQDVVNYLKANGGGHIWNTQSGTWVSTVSPSGQVGVGGPKAAIGNRRSTLMSAHHPDLKLPVRYPQTLRAVGGPAAHTANVHRVAHAAGVHPARLLALNSHYRGIVRIA